MTSLIADSGATSTKWCVIISNEISEAYYTEGLNPYYHTAQSISNVINGELMPKVKGHQINQIHFYGAGCDTPEQNQKLFKPLHAAFPKAAIEVKHDLLGSARACFFNEPGIACILGTGSNSCLYDGKSVIEHIPSLSFILGDEGSAGYFGKKLLNSYFRYELPDELKEKLDSSYNMDLNYIISGVYEGQQISRFVASYARFLGDHQDHPFAKAMLREGFENFINRLLKNYTNFESYKVSFVGSVAFAHQELISEILEGEGFIPGSFFRNPLDRLIAFHTRTAGNKS
jgi:N-acetylglucosamine kinase-like BadF-type ATPase